MISLCEALTKNKVTKKVALKECELVDDAARAIATMLETNTTLEELDLHGNRLTTPGMVALANGLAKNRGLKALTVLGQTQGAFGEDAVNAFLRAFEYNLTLVKLQWQVDSTRQFEVGKQLSRNIEIQKRIANGSDYSLLLPLPLREGGAPAASEAKP